MLTNVEDITQWLYISFIWLKVKKEATIKKELKNKTIFELMKTIFGWTHPLWQLFFFLIYQEKSCQTEFKKKMLIVKH